jgi:asparagine synthase (glutamine-hydrolysing)
VPGGENTFFKNVKKLLPGHYATYDLRNHTLEIKKYFNVDFAIDKTKSFEGYVAEISQTFKDSVSAHMISDPDIKVGAFLSGGVDSAYTVAEVKKHVSPQTYTIDFEEKKFSEAEDATHTANLLKVQNTRVVVSAEKYLAEASKVQYHMDEPLANPSGNLLYFLSQRTAQDLKAVLSGEGADEMFGGYNVYQEPLALANYQKLPLFFRKVLANLFVNFNKFYSKVFGRNIFGLNFILRGAKTIEERYVGNSNVFAVGEQQSIFNPDFYNLHKETFTKYSPQDYTTPIYNELKTILGTEKYAELDDVSKMQYLDIHLWMVHEILQKADKMSMAHSLELRVPFLDIEIWKLGKTLPLHYKVDKTNTKLAERAAAARRAVELAKTAGEDASQSQELLEKINKK